MSKILHKLMSSWKIILAAKILIFLLLSLCYAIEMTFAYSLPRVSNVTSSTPNGSYNKGENIDITINFSNSVTLSGGNLKITLETGPIDRTVTLTSISSSSTASATYKVKKGDCTSDLNVSSVALSKHATLKDSAGNDCDLSLPSANNLADNKDIIIDTASPSITTITSSTDNGSYKAGDSINITLNFSEPVSLSAGNLIVTLETGPIDRTLTFTSISSSSTASATYTVQAQDLTSDLNVSSVALSKNATLKDTAGNDCDLSLPSANNLADNKDIVIDTASPSTTTITSSSDNGTYKAGDSINITLNFSEPVSLSAGNLIVTLETGPIDRTLTFTSISSSSTASATYTVQGQDSSSDLNVSSVALSKHGTLKDSAGNDCDLSLPSANNLADNKDIVIDTTSQIVGQSPLLGYLYYLVNQTGNLISLTCDCDKDGLLPIKIDLYDMLNSALVASTQQDSSAEMNIYFTDCSTGEYFIDGNLPEGPYTIVATDLDLNDESCYEDANYLGIFEPLTINFLLNEENNRQNIVMSRPPHTYHQIEGTIDKDPNGPSIITLMLYGNEENTDSSVKKRTLINETDFGYYRFSVISGEYTLLAQAKGYKGKTAIVNVNDSNVVKNFILNKADPSVSIIRENVSNIFSLMLHFRYNSSLGEPQGWTEAKATLTLSLFTTDDDFDVDGIPDDYNNPSGPIIHTVPSNEGIFDVEYLTGTIELGNLLGNPNNVMTIMEDHYIVGLRCQIETVKGEIYPFVKTFKVDIPDEDKAQFLFETQESIKLKEISTKTHIPITAKISEDKTLKTYFNASNLDPTLLFYVDTLGNKMTNVNLDQELELMIEYKKMTNDNKIVINIAFKDPNGSLVEYNPPDKNTGERNNYAPPIILDIPLHTDLQNLILDPEVTLTDIKELVAKDANDFMIINEVWQPKLELYGIYFESSPGMIEVFKPDPNKTENILVIATDSNLVFARAIVTHTSKWYSSLLEKITCNVITYPLPHIEGECEVSVTPPVAIDTCGKLITATTTNPTTYSSQGTYTITWIYSDYLHTTQTQKVIVSENAITYPTLSDVEGECEVSVTPPVAVDTSGKLITATTTNPTYYSSQGIYTITWIYNDYLATTQTQKVIVSDTQPPIPDTDPLPDIFAESEITLTPPTAKDNCSGSIKATTTDPTTYFNPGTYTLTWSYDDGHGNYTNQKQTLTIVDVPPTIICPPDIIIERCNTEVIAVELGEATVFDISDPNLLIVNDAPKFFPIGTTFVTWTATDFLNNHSSCTQTVTIGPPNSPKIDFSGTPTSGNAPLNVLFTLTNSGGPVTNLYWDFGDGESSTEQNPQHTYRSMGEYTVSLNAVGLGGEGGKVKSNYIVVKAANGPDLTGSWINPGHLNLSSNIHRGLSRKTVSVKNMLQLMLRGWYPLKKRIKFRVKNIGNVKASNRFKVAFYFSMDGTTCEQLFKKKYIYKKLNAGQNKIFYYWFIKNYNQTWKYIIAVIDPDDQVDETDETNNKITFQL